MKKKYVYATARGAKRLVRLAHKMGIEAHSRGERLAIEYEGFRRVCLKAGILPLTFGVFEGWEGWLYPAKSSEQEG